MTTTGGDDCVVTVAKPAFVVNSSSAVFTRKQLLDDTINSNVLSIADLEANAAKDDDDDLQWPPLVISHQPLPTGVQDVRLKQQGLYFRVFAAF
jgi:hypothetical protein